MSDGRPPFPPSDGSGDAQSDPVEPGFVAGSGEPESGAPATVPIDVARAAGASDLNAGGRNPGRSRAARRRAPAEDARPRDVVRTIARGLGQTLITAGVVVLLFVVYEVWITDIFSGEKQQQATSQLDQAWQSSSPSTTPSAGAIIPSAGAATVTGASPTIATGTQVVTVTDPNKLITDPRTRKRTYQTFTGQGFAKIYIPSFGADYVYTVIEGTDADDLDVGPGHYQDTQYPGEQGNFAMAGHRVSKGSPFNELGQLSSCDALVVETKDDWFVYRVLPMADEMSGWTAAARPHCANVAPLTGPYQGVAGREIVDPSDYAQVLPVPQVDSSTIPANAQRLITLTTCHPQFSDSQRMIIHGVLVKSYQKAAGFLPPELTEG